MSRTVPIPPPGFDDLSAEEKLDYVQSLWDRIVTGPEQLPVPDWHRQIVEERLAAHRADPTVARPGEEVRQEINERLKDHRIRRE